MALMDPWLCCLAPSRSPWFTCTHLAVCASPSHRAPGPVDSQVARIQPDWLSRVRVYTPMESLHLPTFCAELVRFAFEMHCCNPFESHSHYTSLLDPEQISGPNLLGLTQAITKVRFPDGRANQFGGICTVS